MGKRAEETDFDVMPGIPEPDTDPLPENCIYLDEGCGLAESCLNCSFEQCIYERFHTRDKHLKAERAKEIARIFTTEGKSVQELAEQFGISERTIQRNLRTVLGKKRSKENEKHV